MARRRKNRTFSYKGALPGPGHVYVLWAPDHQRLKVGGTRRLLRRLAELRMVYGYNAALVAAWSVPDVPSAETLAHKLCHRYKIIHEQYEPAVDWLGEYEVARILSGAFG